MADKNEVAWLIERQFGATNVGARWLGVSGVVNDWIAPSEASGHFYWTDEANYAVPFARRIDAVACLAAVRWLEGNIPYRLAEIYADDPRITITDHMWIGEAPYATPRATTEEGQ